MEIGNVVKLKEKSLYYQMYEHDTFEIEKDWDKKHWVIRGLGPIAFLWLIIPKNEIEVIVTAHEKLIEMGYEFTKRKDYAFYRHDELPKVTIYNDKTYSCGDTNLELSKILTQYLEELENE